MLEEYDENESRVLNKKGWSLRSYLGLGKKSTLPKPTKQPPSSSRGGKQQKKGTDGGDQQLPDGWKLGAFPSGEENYYHTSREKSWTRPATFSNSTSKNNERKEVLSALRSYIAERDTLRNVIADRSSDPGVVDESRDDVDQVSRHRGECKNNLTSTNHSLTTTSASTVVVPSTAMASTKNVVVVTSLVSSSDFLPTIHELSGVSSTTQSSDSSQCSSDAATKPLTDKRSFLSSTNQGSDHDDQGSDHSSSSNGTKLSTNASKSSVTSPGITANISPQSPPCGDNSDIETTPRSINDFGQVRIVRKKIEQDTTPTAAQLSYCCGTGMPFARDENMETKFKQISFISTDSGDIKMKPSNLFNCVVQTDASAKKEDGVPIQGMTCERDNTTVTVDEASCWSAFTTFFTPIATADTVNCNPDVANDKCHLQNPGTPLARSTPILRTRSFPETPRDRAELIDKAVTLANIQQEAEVQRSTSLVALREDKSANAQEGLLHRFMKIAVCTDNLLTCLGPAVDQVSQIDATCKELNATISTIRGVDKEPEMKDRALKEARRANEEATATIVELLQKYNETKAAYVRDEIKLKKEAADAGAKLADMEEEIQKKTEALTNELDQNMELQAQIIRLTQSIANFWDEELINRQVQLDMEKKILSLEYDLEVGRKLALEMALKEICEELGQIQDNHDREARSVHILSELLEKTTTKLNSFDSTLLDERADVDEQLQIQILSLQTERQSLEAMLNSASISEHECAQKLNEYLSIVESIEESLKQASSDIEAQVHDMVAIEEELTHINKVKGESTEEIEHTYYESIKICCPGVPDPSTSATVTDKKSFGGSVSSSEFELCSTGKFLIASKSEDFGCSVSENATLPTSDLAPSQPLSEEEHLNLVEVIEGPSLPHNLEECYARSESPKSMMNIAGDDSSGNSFLRRLSVIKLSRSSGSRDSGKSKRSPQKDEQLSKSRSSSSNASSQSHTSQQFAKKSFVSRSSASSESSQSKNSQQDVNVMSMSRFLASNGSGKCTESRQILNSSWSVAEQNIVLSASSAAVCASVSRYGARATTSRGFHEDLAVSEAVSDVKIDSSTSNSTEESFKTSRSEEISIAPPASISFGREWLSSSSCQEQVSTSSSDDVTEDAISSELCTTSCENSLQDTTWSSESDSLQDTTWSSASDDDTMYSAQASKQGMVELGSKRGTSKPKHISNDKTERKSPQHWDINLDTSQRLLPPLHPQYRARNRGSMPGTLVQ